MAFLDVQITGADKKITTSVYNEPTFRGIYAHFLSFLPSTKFGIAYALLPDMFTLY